MNEAFQRSNVQFEQAAEAMARVFQTTERIVREPPPRASGTVVREVRRELPSGGAELTYTREYRVGGKDEQQKPPEPPRKTIYDRLNEDEDLE